MREVWKTIPGFKNYEASSKGRVRSSAKRWIGGKKILKPADNGNGYLYVKLFPGENKKRKVYVHQAVLLAFAGARPEGYQAAHLNGKRTDNRADNLAWKTRDENNLNDKVATGSALPDSKVLLIQAMLTEGCSQKDIAELVGVSLGTIRSIASEQRQPVFVTERPGAIYDEIGRIAAARGADV